MGEKERKCTVVKREVTEEEFAAILEMQKPFVTTNNRSGTETAFEKAIKGSKAFLQNKGLL